MAREEAALDGASWFDANWMFVGPFLFLPLALVPVVRRKGSAIRGLMWCLPLMYSCHQFEEHGFDVLGERYAFMGGANALGCKSVGVCLIPQTVTIINVVIVWVGFPLGALFAEGTGNFAPAALMFAAAFFNGLVAHVAMPVVTRSYNPGFLSGLLLLVPAGLFVMWRVKELAGLRYTILALVYGGPVCHGLMLALAVWAEARGLVGLAAFGLWVAFGWIGLPFLIGTQLKSGLEAAARGEEERANPEESAQPSSPTSADE